MAVGDAVFQVFQAFQTSVSTFKCHMDVAKVDIECFICCNDNIRMFQAYVQSISVVSDTCFKCFHLDVAYVCYSCIHVSTVCFHVFQIFHTYVAKVDLDVAYVAI